MKNQTQTAVEAAARAVITDWITGGPRTLERLHATADEWAKRKNVPSVMVRSTALNLLKERLPDMWREINEKASTR